MRMRSFDKDKYLRRLETLAQDMGDSERLRETPSEMTTEATYHSLLNLCGNIYGTDSVQVQQLLTFWKANATGTMIHLEQREKQGARRNFLRGLIHSLKGDIENDLIEDIELAATGSVLADFTGLAKSHLDAGSKDVAAVLASSAFEDTMKRKAELLNISTEMKSLEDVVSALKSQAVFKGVQAKLTTGFIALRNNAMHANWEKVNAPETRSMIAFTEQFLIEHFS